MEIINARIKSTWLGSEDHGIFTAVLTLDLGDATQGFGTYDLRSEDSAYKFVHNCLKITGAPRWEDLPGRPLRAMRENGLIVGIGDLLKNEWFKPADMYKEKTSAPR